MKLAGRMILDKTFTTLTALSVLLLSVILLVVLGPMIYRGSGAVIFRGTVEFRKMQMGLFERGDAEALDAEIAQAQEVRDAVYRQIDEFRQGIDTEELNEKARKIHREFGGELRSNGITGDEYSELRSLTKDIRDKLEEASESQDKALIRRNIEDVLEHQDDDRLKGTLAAGFFPLAANFSKAVENADLAKLSQYTEAIEQVEDILRQLFGPKPGEPTPALARMRYGATRCDQAQILLGKLLWIEKWVQTEPGKPLEKIKTPRSEQFAGTPLESLPGFVEKNLAKMLRPRLTFYWQYFIDDSYNSHYFGGVGPEILGTLLITVLGMLFAIPLGLVSAAYLVECASDNLAVKIIRMCINSLAGVPSIVFGLFGLAFFVLYLLPTFGLPSQGCILAASLTLAILTLPVMIRASEEAIRSVPQTYKEASLALGASRFRTFVTVTLPAALPGILTGIILSLSRIAGETAPILFTGAVALGPVPKSVFQPTRTLSYGSYDMAVGDRVAMMVPHNQYGMVVTLVVLILLLNGMAIMLRGRVFKKLQGR
ncbi:MAG: phosphate ABC transporter permease PstA [Sedimentisphaerales bacterium]|nr:phosphate ABC transporter permease PstA [Sedimentisphaerales bacterium]